jgi:hypothetical protein
MKFSADSFRRNKSRWIAAGAILFVAVGVTVWRLGAGGDGSGVDKAANERAEKIRSEIQDYTPPELNVPDTAPRPEKLQTQSTRQPKRVN